MDGSLRPCGSFPWTRSDYYVRRGSEGQKDIVSNKGGLRVRGDDGGRGLTCRSSFGVSVPRRDPGQGVSHFG